jgi:hypothetical protein
LNPHKTVTEGVMTNDIEHESDATLKPPETFTVRLVAAGANDLIPGVPLTNTRLPSLDTPRIQRWVSQYQDSVVFVLPEEQELSAQSSPVREKPSLSTEVGADEYDSLIALLPN